MALTAWERLKKKLPELPLEQALRLLRESLENERDAKVKEEIRKELVHTEKAAPKEDVRPVTSAPTLRELAEERVEPERPIREETLEETLARTPAPVEEQGKQRDYLTAGQEYKALGKDDLLYHSLDRANGDSARPSDFSVREERMKTEAERIWEENTASRQTEMYKKKRTL
jgi:hypothetical protein